MEGHHGLGAVPDKAKGNHTGEVEEAEQGMELEQAGPNLGFGAEEEGLDNSNACCICHEPWPWYGGHRICCIPCGHVYGRSCLEAWLVQSGCREAKRLWCEKEFKREDIVTLYGTTEHLWDGRHNEQAATQVAAEEEAATRQVTRAAMEALVARQIAGIIVRERAQMAQENLEFARRNQESAQQNLETARQNLLGAYVNKAMSIVLVICSVIVALHSYNLYSVWLSRY